MAFKDLLLVTGESTEAGNRFGLWLAGICDATLTATPALAGGYPPNFFVSEMPRSLLDQIREDAEKAVHSTLEAFFERAKQAGISAEIVMPDMASEDISGDVSRLARYYDATVLQQPSPQGPDTSRIIEAVLFGSGRPVVIVPYIIDAAPQLGTVLIAWDEGRPAARAVRDALPLLTLAKRVEIVTVNRTTRSKHLLQDDLARHLARHGITVEQKSMSRGEIDVADALLSYAADESADLMVMGGYGHSRLREIVLGGTTHTILKSMTVPVLMAH
jgi:nucleotide-binding universal stress UspA family protein